MVIFLSILKFFKIFGLITIALSFVASAYMSVTQQDPSYFLQDVASRTLASDKTIYDNMLILTTASITDTQKISAVWNVWSGLNTMVFIIWIFKSIFKLAFGDVSPFFLWVFALLLVGVAQISYVAVTDKVFTVPFKGIVFMFKNLLALLTPLNNILAKIDNSTISP